VLSENTQELLDVGKADPWMFSGARMTALQNIFGVRN